MERARNWSTSKTRSSSGKTQSFDAADPLGAAEQHAEAKAHSQPTHIRRMGFRLARYSCFKSPIFVAAGSGRMVLMSRATVFLSVCVCSFIASERFRFVLRSACCGTDHCSA